MSKLKYPSSAAPRLWHQEPVLWKTSFSLDLGRGGFLDGLSTSHLIVHLGFPSGSEGKASAHNAGDLGLIPGSGRSPGEGNGNPLQYSCLENNFTFTLFLLLHQLHLRSSRLKSQRLEKPVLGHLWPLLSSSFVQLNSALELFQYSAVPFTIENFSLFLYFCALRNA